ncbi:MAG: response regulator [Oscillospiraceae bacterium]|jgi:signal transduction histidine kinase/ActR/RegA family two-component response regulator|nr:response regulator [Oscillospiraceae bacterium]
MYSGSNEYFFLEHSPYAAMVLDENVVPINCNQAMIDLAGSEPGGKEAFLRGFMQKLSDAIPENQPDGDFSIPFAERLRQLFNAGNIRFETALNFPAGSVVADVHMSLVELNGRKLILAYMLDLSQLRTARRELEKKEQLLRALNTLADKYILTPDIHSAVADMEGSLRILRNAIGCPYGVIGGYNLPGAEGSSIEEAFVNIPGISGCIPTKPVNISAKDFPPGAHIRTLPAGVTSILFVPIYLFGEYWGYLLFAENRRHRPASQAVIELISSAGLIIAAACRRAAKMDEFRIAIETANAATKSKSEFLTRMSHEIRTPLNAIIGTASVAALDEEVRGSTKFSAFLRTIDSSSRHLLHLINEILDMSQIESGKMTIEQSPFVLEAMLDRVRSIIAARAADNDLRFLTDLPRLGEYVIGDELRISQVLINLLGNAAKFTPRGGEIRLTVRYNARDSGDTLYCEIADTGIGVTPEQKERLFVAFEQADGSIARKFGGSGLGLAISSNLVGLMGGTLELDSEYGEGSVFSFEIPVSLGGEIDRNRQSESFFEADWSDKHILVVDDVELNRTILIALLERTGARFSEADNGKSAIDFFAEGGRCDLVLMDLQMPEIDGLTATAELRRLDVAIPIVAMTANVFREDIDRCIEAGMNGHLGKPIDPAELFKTLASYLSIKNT